MPDWKSIEYLSEGNKRQKEAYFVLKETAILEKLNNYHPILVGTIPIDIDIESSDLDIICQTDDYKTFGDLIQLHFQHFEGFSTNINESRYLARFRFKNFEIEVFATNQPTDLQPAYRHMIVEDRILQLLGINFRNEIRVLKNKGLKTEPAFGQLLTIKENPYEELLKYEKLSLSELKEKLSSFISKYHSY